MNKEKIIEEAKVYVNGDMTVRETAEVLGISRKTFQIHLKYLGEIDPLLFSLVVAKKESNIKTGRIKGGKLGKSKPRYTSEKANSIANGMIVNSYTYEEASKVYGIPKSTIYEMVHSTYITDDIKMMLDEVASDNNKKKNASGKRN